MIELLTAARSVQARAYVPYSRFRVGCALRADDGRIFTGANVENAAYPQGQCAEASAIGALIAGGARRIVEAAVIGDSEAPCSPCGGCRQRLAEFAALDTRIHMAGTDGALISVTLGDLLPHGFGPAHLAAEAGDPGPERADAAARIRAGAGTEMRPDVAIILGSGLGDVLGPLADAVAIPYAELPGFPSTSVPSHAGRLVIGRVEGRAVAVLQGRAHLYEGTSAAWPRVPIRALKALGVRTLVLTNAAGSLRPEVGPGRICLIIDHINALGVNPLTGPNDDEAGPRFPDMSEVYDAALRQDLAAHAAREGIDLARGVYLATPGPSFETPAEIRAMRTLGADLVGMSTVPEAIVARHAGLRVAGLAVVTNLAAGLGEGALSHDETLSGARIASSDLGRLLRAWLRSSPELQESRP